MLYYILQLIASRNKRSVFRKKKMASDSTSKVVATEAWSQLVQSIISDSPPSDMEAGYYHTFRETGSDYLQKQLKRLEVYKYKLGTENILAKISGVVPANKHKNQQTVKHNRDISRPQKHSKIAQATESDIEQGIDHIRSLVKSNKVSEMVQENEHEKQGIEHVRTLVRSNKLSEEVKASEDDYQQGIEHIQSIARSQKYSKKVQENENEYEQGIEHIRSLIRSNKHSEVMQSKEHEYGQEIEHIRSLVRSNKHSEAIEANDDEILQGNKDIQDNIRSTVLFKPTEYEDHPSRDYIVESTRPKKSDKMLHELEYAHQQLNNYREAKKMSTLFDELLELIEYGDLHGDEKLTLRISVLKVIKLLHHYGVDTICTAVDEELKGLNHTHSDTVQDLGRQYKKEGLEVMLKICKNETSQSTMYEIIGKAERDQVLYKW